MVNYKKKHKILALVMMIVFISSCLFINLNNVEAYSVSTKKEGVSNFPSSYQSYLNALKAKHSNWNFVAVYTHLDWDYVVSQEMVTNRSLVPSSYPSAWKLNDTEVESGWVNASKSAVSYALDPRNYLTEEKIFQFEVNTYNSSEHTVDAVTNILKGTPMGEVVDGVDYTRKYKKSGVWVDMDKSYAEIIVEAGKKYNVSPVHLASRIIQENGGNILNNKCISGSYSGFEGYYNFMNINATPTGAGAVVNALTYAKNNGWTDPEKAINGAAKKIYDQYIYYGQNTVYFEKFDVNFVETSQYLFGSQYMTNILAPSSESTFMYKAYNATNKMDSSFTFHIPVYDNMPSSSVSVTDGSYIEDNTLVYLDDTSDTGVTDVFNIRSTPYSNSSSNIIAVITETEEGQENRTLMTRILKGDGTGWDKVRLEDGREGYVASQYVKVYSYVKVTGVSLNETSKTVKVGETFTLTATVSPSNAKNKNVTWVSSNEDIASVDSNGKVTAVKEGTATITVSTNDQSKTAKCTVTVGNTLATKISTKYSEYSVGKDSYLAISPDIEPATTTNKDFDITVRDETVATVENGKIKGVSVGTTEVTLTTKDTSNLSCTFTLNVKENDVTVTDKLNLSSDGIITNVEPETKASVIKENINTDYTIKLYNASGSELSDTDIVTTDTQIILYDDNTRVYEYNILIRGDTNGDGKINSADLLKIVQYLKSLSTINVNAADTNEDGKVNSADLLKLVQHLKGTSKISFK